MTSRLQAISRNTTSLAEIRLEALAVLATAPRVWDADQFALLKANLDQDKSVTIRSLAGGSDLEIEADTRNCWNWPTCSRSSGRWKSTGYWRRTNKVVMKPLARNWWPR